MTDPCLFCRIVRGEIPASIVYQDADVLAFRDINPQAPTHLLIIPTRHVPDMLHLGAEESALLGRIFSLAAQLARDEGIAGEGFRFVANTGPAAGQTVPHLHFHLLGGRPLAWPPG